MKHILMIKKSMNTGLMYLCKTTTKAKRDPYEYKGSGKYWLRHLKKHKPHIITCVIGEYDSKEDLKKQGEILSEQWDVVNSDKWANLTPERGDGGWIHNQEGNTWKVSEQGRENMRKSRLKNKNSYKKQWELFKDRITGGSNYQCTHYINTPWGRFETMKDALEKAAMLRDEGRKDVITDRETLKKYCKCDIVLNKEGRRTFPDWRGKSTKQLGFYIEKKHE